jgi:putative ATP-dependent endonuclease of OLD family
VGTIERIRTGKSPKALFAELTALEDYSELEERLDAFGVFTNVHTLEVDLFKGGFGAATLETLREGKFGPERSAWIDAWESNPATLDIERFLSMIDDMGKGRFAQRLATRIADLDPPEYISRAIAFVAERV